MPKHIFTIEIEEPIDEEDVSEIIVISNKGISTRAKIIPNVNHNLDGSSYDINLSNYVRNMKELEEMWTICFYQKKFMEYIEHFPNISLDLSYNHLTDDYLHNILKVFQDEKMDLLRQKVVKINIEQNRIGRRGFLELFQYINNCPNFRELEADINFLSRSEYQSLKDSRDIPKSIRDNFTYQNF